MKKLVLFLLLTLTLLANEVELFPKIEKVRGVKPWWVKEVHPVEGMTGGVGIVPLDLYKNDSERRAAAMEAARREIAATKSTIVQSEIKLQQDNFDSNLDIDSTQFINGDVKALLIDTWEDSENYYVWMAEFLDRVSYENLKVYINKKNIATIQNRINVIKYEGRTIVTNKDGGKVTLNIGKDSGVEVGEVFYIYRLEDESVNPLSNQVEDFTKEKISEVVIKEVFPKSARAQASFMGNFKIQIGDIAYSAGYTEDQKVEEARVIKEEKKQKYDYDLTYIPKVRNIERAGTLSTRQYSISAATDFDTTSFDARIGLFRFFETALRYDFADENGFDFLAKVGVPINRDTIIGLAYEKNWINDNEYLIGLFEYQFAEGFGVANLSYRGPLGNVTESEFLGGAIQLQPSSSVILGTEYGRYLESNGSSEFTVKVNLEVMDEIWFGAGVSWLEDRRYFIKLEHLNII